MWSDLKKKDKGREENGELKPEPEEEKSVRLVRRNSFNKDRPNCEYLRCL